MDFRHHRIDFVACEARKSIPRSEIRKEAAVRKENVDMGIIKGGEKVRYVDMYIVHQILSFNQADSHPDYANIDALDQLFLLI